MDLNQDDLEQLADFFGRRLDPTLSRTPAPADEREGRRRAAAWLLVLEEAQEQQKLSGLFARIQHKHPEDPQLQGAVQLLLEPGARGNTAVGAVLLAAMAAGFLILTTAATGSGALVWYSLSNPEAVRAHENIGHVHIATVETGTDQVARRSEHAPPTGRCTRPDGGVVGYWYAGAERPGARGDVVHLTGMRNVRLTWPGKHNEFDSRSHIECLLQPGDRVRLSQAPIHVPGGAWWVPLSSGDLVR